MSQLIKLSLVKRDITTMSGKYLFNVSRITNLKATGTDSIFNYKEKHEIVPWVVDETYAVVSPQTVNYDASIRMAVYIEKKNEYVINATTQIEVDRIVYGFADPGNSGKTVIIYDDPIEHMEVILKVAGGVDSIMNLANALVAGVEAEGVFHKTMTQTLSSGSNTVTHMLGTDKSATVTGLDVWDGTAWVATDISIIDSDNLNVILAG
ncbi:hypothetical protein KKE60_08650, partial [Patescibacteria group bacterium]|nr:hypothetical protein [Patescibacteria group bacterium]